ncbi:hypothetical protein CHL78_005820 [Romboutsia weinsteinii]|uniref:Chromosome segregation ATPase n=1 Tax=Romboutsia weinsteinii TaxID=2020949 RepID=A0A371J6Q3_9FIRM|nr:hypothetical protein [Romboutsia weinsteinii]RDY28414.1 hypothetical protein CHL78_005820 [Romboutsia weinsteinii]
MAKLNGYRIVNLTYNVKDNGNTSTNRIIDQNFELEGLQSLILLQNGGGKSVQIQMLISPFVSPKYRDFGSRPFTDYFNDDRTPTYIATEWVLDSGEKVLIGLMVRKCKPNEVTDSNRGLDIYSYVYEYKDKFDKYSIDNIPFAQRTEEGYIISSSQETLELFSNIKKRNKFAMEYYNLNVQGSRTKYYEKLKTYDIERSEWETIMKTINSSEGGLTELFKDCPDESKLLEAWFLKIIHSKLNKELKLLEEMRNSFRRYFENKKSKQHAIDIVDGISEYTQYANNILEVNAEHKEVLQEIEKNKSRIEDIYTYNHITQKVLNCQREKCIESGQELQKELAMIKYKEASYKYYIAYDESIKAEEVLKKESDNLEELEEKLSNLEREYKLQEVIKINSEKRAKEKQLEELVAKREKENQSNEQIRAKLENVAYSLRGVLNEELDAKYEVLDNLKCEKDNFNNECSDINKDIGRITEANKRLNIDKIKSDKIVEEIKPKVDKLRSTYNAPLFLDDIYFDKLETDKNQEILNKQTIIDNTNEELVALEEDIKKIEKEINTIENNEIKCDYELNSKTKELQNIESECNKMRLVLEYLELNQENIFDTIHTLKEIDTKILNVQQKINSDTSHKDKMQVEIEQLEKGVVVELPKEVKNLLKGLDINYQLGLYYVSKLNISAEQKEDLIKKNPFLPFSIVISSEDIEILKNSKVELSSSYTVYIANIDKISTSIEYVFSNNVSEVGNLKMLYNFNKALLDETEKVKMISKIKNEISRLEDLIRNNEVHRKGLESKRFFIQNFKITKLIVTTTEDKVNTLKAKQETLLKSKEDRTNKVLELNNILVPKKNEQIENLNKELKDLESELEEIKQFSSDYTNLDEAFNNAVKINDELEFNEKTYEKHTKRLSEIMQLEKVLDKEISMSESSIRETETLLTEINLLKLKFENPIVMTDEKSKLEAQFKVLKEDSNKNIKEIQSEIAKVDDEIKSKDKEINGLSNEFEFELQEYDNKEYIIERKIFINKSINQTKGEISTHRDVEKNLLTTSSKISSKMEKALEDAKKKSNNVIETYSKYKSTIEIEEGVIDKTLIIETNFEELKNITQELIKETLNEKDSIDSNISLINTSSEKLGFLSYIKDGITDINTRTINTDINLERLLSITGKEIDLYRGLERGITDIKLRIDKIFTQLSTDFKYRDINPYAKNIKGLLEFKHDPTTVEIAINATFESLEKRRLQYEEDLKLIDKEHRSTINTILKYVENVHSHMDSIDTNSSINLNNKRVKMLEIKQPDWEQSVATTKVEAFLDKLIDGCDVRYALGESSNQTPDEFIASQMTTNKLYDAIVGIHNVKILIKKLEFAGEEIDVSPITWKKAQKNSGGEGFATYFIILISLLSYMRKESSLIGDRTKESSKVLIMDNPFGKISSEHLLKPVMEIAKKYNTQLLCFTAQKGDNIYNEFDNIYHLNLELILSSKTKILTAEREVRGNVEKDAHMQSSQLKLLSFD